VLDGTIRRIAQRGFDRILEIDIDGEHGSVQLMGEFIGNRSNLILCQRNENGERIVLHAAKLTTSKQNRQREILPGRVYPELPKQGIDPREINVAAWRAMPDVAEDNLSAARCAPTNFKSTFEGISPLLEKEILFLAPDNFQQGLHSVIEKSKNWNPGIYLDSEKNAVLAYPFELQHLESTFIWQPAKSIHDALEIVYREAAPKVLLAQRKSTLEGIVKKSIQHREHALRQVQQGLGESGRAAKHRNFGELLFAHLQDVPPGVESVTLHDFYEDKEVAISLDKDLSPAENAAHYFERAKRSEAGRAVLETRQTQLEEELQQEKVLLERIQNADSLEKLNALNPADGSEIDLPSAKNQKRARFEGHRIKIFQSPDGYEILVGENATSNDFLVKRVMRPNDWWLHVRGNTSAHAVISTNGNPQKVPQNTLLFAARQVAGRSASKHAGYAAVDYTLGKYVRKPRKAAPGAVTYEREKTLHLMKEDNE
jgi:predicted ribosome quality control (RQC) complex YloA/Tae2 family protein